MSLLIGKEAMRIAMYQIYNLIHCKISGRNQDKA